MVLHSIDSVVCVAAARQQRLTESPAVSVHIIEVWYGDRLLSSNTVACWNIWNTAS